MSKIDEARDILEQLGLPQAQQNEISCLTLLALTACPRVTLESCFPAVPNHPRDTRLHAGCV